MGGNIASVGLIALVLCFVAWALIGGRQGPQPPVTVEPPPSPREEQPIAVKEPAVVVPPKSVELKLEEKLAYAPEDGLIPKPAEPPKAAPVPSVTDTVSPPPPAEKQTEAKQEPAPTPTPPPADKLPTPVETEASSVATASEWEPAAKAGYEAEKQDEPATPGSGELSSEQVAWGIKASDCLKTQHPDSGCYVTHRREKKQLRIWCPSRVPESVPQECSHEAHMATFQE